MVLFMRKADEQWLEGESVRLWDALKVGMHSMVVLWGEHWHEIKVL